MTDPAIESQATEAPHLDAQHLEPAPAALPPMPVAATKKSSRSGTIALLVAGFIAAAGLAFAAGRLTAPAAAAGTTNGPTGGFRFGPGRSLAPGQTFPAGAQFGGGRAFGDGLTVRGEVTAIATDSITIKLDDGTSLQIPLNGSTTFHQATSSSGEDVAVGDKVAVQAGTPTITDGGPASAPAASPGSGGFGQFQLGPATDVTVIQN